MQKNARLSIYCHPNVVVAGNIVAIDGHASGLNWFLKTVYYFSSDGGPIRGKVGKRHVYIDTTGLNPGIYTVKGHVSQGSFPDEQQAEGRGFFEVLA